MATDDEDEGETIRELRSELCALVVRARVRTERTMARVPVTKREVVRSTWLAARARPYRYIAARRQVPIHLRCRHEVKRDTRKRPMRQFRAKIGLMGPPSDG